MSDSESTTKVQSQGPQGAESALSPTSSQPPLQSDTSSTENEEVPSLESIDALLAAEDPEFAQSLSGIGPDDPENMQIYDEGLELEYTLEDEIKLWAKASKRRQKIAKLFPFIPKVSYHLKLQRSSLRLSWIKWRRQLREFILNAGPLLIAALKGLLKKVSSAVGAVLSAFKAFSLIQKLAFVGLLAGTGGAGYLLYKIANHKLFPEEKGLFINSLEEWAQNKYLLTDEDQTEYFYDSTRTAQNIIALNKLLVNLRPSKNSGANPMGAFDFYLEGTASETVIEIKDREPEVDDLFLRTIEEMTYDQLASAEGKHSLCERLRKEVNKILTKGKIRRVFIRTAIIKP